MCQTGDAIDFLKISINCAHDIPKYNNKVVGNEKKNMEKFIIFIACFCLMTIIALSIIIMRWKRFMKCSRGVY